MLGLVVMFLIWIKDNIPGKLDLEWLKQGGGMLSKGKHPPAKRFNAGQKGIFWIVMIGGALMSVSGWFLLFPYIPGNVTVLQFWTVIHAVIAMLFIAAMLAHIYIGSIGMEGAFDAMGTGEVDLNWAKEHHSLWVEEEQERPRAVRPRAAPCRLNNPAHVKAVRGKCHESLCCGFGVCGGRRRRRGGVPQHHPGAEFRRLHHQGRQGRRPRQQSDRAELTPAVARARRHAWRGRSKSGWQRIAGRCSVAFDDGGLSTFPPNCSASPAHRPRCRGIPRRSARRSAASATSPFSRSIPSAITRCGSGFDDMHSTGIYSWAFLRDLGVNAERRFQDYLDDLQAKGLDRDRPGMR